MFELVPCFEKSERADTIFKAVTDPTLARSLRPIASRSRPLNACKRIQAYAPDALVISLGVDTCVSDSIAKFRLDTPEHPRFVAQLAGLRLPTLFVMKEMGECHASITRVSGGGGVSP